MEQRQRSFSSGSGDCASCSPSSSDSPLSITPDPSLVAFSRKQTPGSPTANASGASSRRASDSSATVIPTQITTIHILTTHEVDPGNSDKEATSTSPPAEALTSSRTVTPPTGQPVSITEPPNHTTQSHLSSPMESRFQFDLVAAPVELSPSACAPSDSDDPDVAVGAAATCYPHYTTPRKERATPSFNNPLFDDSPCLSPWTQPLSTAVDHTPSVSGVSPQPYPSSPTRRLFTMSTTRHHSYRRRQNMQRRFDERMASPHSPDDAAAAAVLAASSLLCRVALRGDRPGRGSLESSLAGYLRRQMEDGIADDVSPRTTVRRRRNERQTIDSMQRRQRHVDPDEIVRGGSDPDDIAGSRRMYATLELMDRAAALQRQLLLRTEEVAALRLQLEEAMGARDEMGVHLLECQEYIADLERRLAEESHARAALAAQSQLLQQQLQEVSEMWQHGQGKDERQGGQGQLPVQQGPGHTPTDAAAAARAPLAMLLMPGSAHGYPGALVGMACSSLDGSDHPVGEHGDGLPSGNDPRDVELAALRRENNSLTQRLIVTSIEAAEAREQEEEARHKAHLLQEINQQYMETVNTMSLELSLLRPNACGRARGVFNLAFLRKGASVAGAGTVSARC